MMILRLVLFVGVAGVLNSAQTPYRCSDAFYTRPDAGQRSWNNAQNVCRQWNAMLPVVSDQQRQSCLVSALRNLNVNTSGESVWIGASTSDPGTWQWVNGSQYTGTDIPAQNGTYGYISLDPDNNVKISATKPTVNLPYICHYTGMDYGNCSSDRNGGIYYNGQCFIRNESKVSWFSARNTCLQTKGDLAFFDDMYLFNGIITYGYWIGLRRNAWNWNNPVNGTTMDVTYTQWSSGQPDGNGSQCISTDTPGDGSSWKDNSCTDTASFICLGFTNFTASQVPPSSASPSTGFTVSRVPPPYPSPATGFSVSQGSPSSAASPTTIFPVDEAQRSSSSPAAGTDNGASENKDGSPNRSLIVAFGVGIGVGLGVPFLVGLIVLIAAIVYFCRRHHKSKTKPKPDRSKQSQEDVEMSNNSLSSLPHEESYGTVNKANHEQLPPYTPAEEDTATRASSHSVPPHTDNYVNVNEEHNDPVPPYNPPEEDPEFDSPPPMESEPLPPPVSQYENHDIDNSEDHEESPPFYPTEDDPDLDASSPYVPEHTSYENYGTVDSEDREQLLDPPSPGDLPNLPPFPEEPSEEHYGIISNENQHDQPDPSTSYEPSDSNVNYAEFNFDDT